MSKTLLYVGTYTYAKDGKQGIFLFQFDPATGELSYRAESGQIDCPSFLAVDRQSRYLYAVSDVSETAEGTLSAFRIDPASGVLTHINTQPTQGATPAHVTLDHTDRYALVANYSSGKAAVVFPLRADGSLESVSGSAEHAGTGPNTARQEGPHPHSATLSPDNRFAFVADLGTDQLVGYALAEGRLTHSSALQMAPGAGPRHLDFHPSGRYAYLIQELDSTISALRYDPALGSFETLQTLSTLPADYPNPNGESTAADVHVAPSGKFVYGSNRGHDSIACYAIDEQTGRLTLVGCYSTQGKTPRNFGIDPSGNFLVVGNQDSHTLVTLRIDSNSGVLSDFGMIASVPSPACVKFVQLGG